MFLELTDCVIGRKEIKLGGRKMKCPESIEELQELEKLIPLCKITLYDQAKARIETGAAKSVSEASRQIAEEIDKDPETIRRAIRREDVSGTLSHLSETDKFRPVSNILATKYTGDEESYTPAKYIESARKVLGVIDLDPASNTQAQETVKASTYYTIEDDGLTKDWSGKVWMNPPYTARIINKFMDKIIDGYVSGNITEAIVLTNNNTDTTWFHEGAAVASAICFTAGRISFYKEDGERSSPTNGQLFFYFGNDINKFKNEFSQHGLVMVKL